MTYREWVNANRRKFLLENYTVREMIELSLAAGWTRDDMAKTLRHWPRALHTSGDPEESASRIGKEQANHFQATIERMNGTSLQDQWHALHDYQEYGQTW